MILKEENMNKKNLIDLASAREYDDLDFGASAAWSLLSGLSRERQFLETILFGHKSNFLKTLLSMSICNLAKLIDSLDWFGNIQGKCGFF